MKLCFFGTQAGISPQAGRNNIAWALEKNGDLHWFDAGENCSRTAFFMDLKVEQIKELFISRFRPDLCCGLPGVAARIQDTLPVYTPSGEVLKSLAPFFTNLNSGVSPFEEQLMDDEGSAECCGVKVSWRAGEKSHFFRIESENRSIVYAPMPVSTAELGDWLHAADVLIWGTENLGAAETCRRLKHEKRQIGKVIFLCNDKMLPGDDEDLRSRIGDIMGSGACFAEDGWIFEL